MLSAPVIVISPIAFPPRFNCRPAASTQNAPSSNVTGVDGLAGSDELYTLMVVHVILNMGLPASATSLTLMAVQEIVKIEKLSTTNSAFSSSASLVATTSALSSTSAFRTASPVSSSMTSFIWTTSMLSICTSSPSASPSGRYASTKSMLTDTFPSGSISFFSPFSSVTRKLMSYARKPAISFVSSSATEASSSFRTSSYFSFSSSASAVPAWSDARFLPTASVSCCATSLTDNSAPLGMTPGSAVTLTITLSSLYSPSNASASSSSSCPSAAASRAAINSSSLSVPVTYWRSSSSKAIYASYAVSACSFSPARKAAYSSADTSPASYPVRISSNASRPGRAAICSLSASIFCWSSIGRRHKSACSCSSISHIAASFSS